MNYFGRLWSSITHRFFSTQTVNDGNVVPNETVRRHESFSNSFETHAHDSTISGSMVNCPVYGTVYMGSIYMGPPVNHPLTQRNQPSGQDDRIANFTAQLKEDFRKSQEWEKLMDHLEIQGLKSLNRPQLNHFLRHLNDFIPPEERILINEDEDQKIIRLLIVLRWRYELEKKVEESLKAMGLEKLWKNALKAKSSTNRSVNRSSFASNRNVPRFRVALQSFSDAEIDQQESATILYKTGCLSCYECRMIRNEETGLSSLLTGKHEQELCIFRHLLRRKYEQSYQSFLRKYITTDVSHDTTYHNNVPELPLPYIHRHQLEDQINRWMLRASTSTELSLLVLHGMGSVGKSCLAVNAGLTEALTTGFHQVYFVRGHGQCFEKVIFTLALQLNIKMSAGLKNNYEQIGAKVKEQFRKMERNGERVLLILDDIVEDRILEYTSSTVLVTSRIETIGKHSCFKNRETIGISGFSPRETEMLLSDILGEPLTDRLKSEPEMWNNVLRLFRQSHYMPLTVNIIASLMKREQAKWIDQNVRNAGIKYVERLKEHIRLSKEELRRQFRNKDIRPHTGNFYRYENVYAALFVSIDRLIDEDRKKYLKLTIFDQGEIILPITMKKIWKEAETTAEESLIYFSTCSLATNIGYDYDDKTQQFLLHDLLYDVLQAITTDKEMEALRRHVVNSYCGSMSHESLNLLMVNKTDRFFYQKFPKLCLTINEDEISASCLCQILYIVIRVKRQLSEDLLNEMKETFRRCHWNEKLSALYRVLQSSLTSAISHQDTDVILRAAISKHFNDDLYEEVREFIHTRQYPFFAYTLSQDTLEPGIQDFVTKSLITDYSRRKVLSLEWNNILQDFVLVYTQSESNDQLIIRQVLAERNLVDCQVNNSMKCLFAITNDRVAIVDNFHLKEWYIYEPNVKQEGQFLRGLTVHGLCYNESTGQLTVLLVYTANPYVFILGELVNGIINPLKEFVNDGLAPDLETSIMNTLSVCNRTNSLHFWSANSLKTWVWSSEGNVLLAVDEIKWCSMNFEKSKLFLCRKKTDSRTTDNDDKWTIKVWDKNSKMPIISRCDDILSSSLVTSSNAKKLAFLTSKHELCVFDNCQEIRRLHISGNSQLLSFTEGDTAILLQSNQMLLKIKLNHLEGPTVLWDWNWLQADWERIIEHSATSPTCDSLAYADMQGNVIIVKRFYK